LVVRAVSRGAPTRGLLIALLLVAPAAGVLHWLQAWLPHPIAHRPLAAPGAADRPAARRPRRGRAALARVLARARHGLPPPRRHAHALLPQAGGARARLPVGAPYRRPARGGHPRHRADRVL